MSLPISSLSGVLMLRISSYVAPPLMFHAIVNAALRMPRTSESRLSINFFAASGLAVRSFIRKNQMRLMYMVVYIRGYNYHT